MVAIQEVSGYRETGAWATHGIAIYLVLVSTSIHTVQHMDVPIMLCYA